MAKFNSQFPGFLTVRLFTLFAVLIKERQNGLRKYFLKYSLSGKDQACSISA